MEESLKNKNLLELFEICHAEESGIAKEELLLRIRTGVRSAINFKKRLGNLFIDNQIRREAGMNNIPFDQTETFMTIVSEGCIILYDRKFLEDFIEEYGRNHEQLKKKIFSKLTIAYDRVEKTVLNRSEISLDDEEHKNGIPLKSKLKKEDMAEGFPVTYIPKPEDMIKKNVENPYVIKALEKIKNQNYRKTLELLYYKELSNYEAAKELDITENTLNQWHSRAKKELRRKLTEILSGPEGLYFEDALKKLKAYCLQHPSVGIMDFIILKLFLEYLPGKKILQKLFRENLLPRPDEVVKKLGHLSPVEDWDIFIKNLRKIHSFFDTYKITDYDLKSEIKIRWKISEEYSITYILQYLLKKRVFYLLGLFYNTLKDICDYEMGGDGDEV